MIRLQTNVRFMIPPCEIMIMQLKKQKTNKQNKKQTKNNKQPSLRFTMILFHNIYIDMKTQSGFHIDCWRESLDPVYNHHFFYNTYHERLRFFCVCGFPVQ